MSKKNRALEPVDSRTPVTIETRGENKRITSHELPLSMCTQLTSLPKILAFIITGAEELLPLEGNIISLSSEVLQLARCLCLFSLLLAGFQRPLLFISRFPSQGGKTALISQLLQSGSLIDNSHCRFRQTIGLKVVHGVELRAVRRKKDSSMFSQRLVARCTKVKEDSGVKTVSFSFQVKPTKSGGDSSLFPFSLVSFSKAYYFGIFPLLLPSYLELSL
ncbi:hypothetical protein Tco_0226725 [Tanacetum coccineum]